MNALFELGADAYAWFTAQPAWRRSCQELAARLPDAGTIVDLGCGPGVSTFELLRQRPAAHLVGLDIATRMLRQARARTPASGIDPGRITWMRADADRLPFRDGAVDAFTGHSFLYLLPHQQVALAEMRRALRLGGRLALMEPNDGRVRLRRLLAVSRDPRFLLSMTLWRPASRFNGRFTARTLEATLTQAGFAHVQVDETLAGLGLIASAERR
jgi:ubiquinone/menaquinone biosynthesis C-methylase UbiE